MAEVSRPKCLRRAVRRATIVRYTGRVPTPSDEVSDLPGWIADRLASARADAQRIAGELVRDGRIDADEVATLAAAVDEAIGRGRALIADALREPRRILAGLRRAGRAESAADAVMSSASPDLAARIARLEERIAALEGSIDPPPSHPRGDGERI